MYTWRTKAVSLGRQFQMPTDDFERELGGDLLAAVARSFYLSLKFLPAELRGPGSLGYLLARATDTVADTETAPAEERLRLLAEMALAVEGGDTQAISADLAQLVKGQDDTVGEAMLLAKFGRCLQWLAAVPEWQREAIRRVLIPITKGQREDLERFMGEGTQVLEADEQLEQYAYDVAGCVGVFWTDLGFGAFDTAFASRPRAEMEELGTNYGKGLQLLNILRDFAEDFDNGRCYFPGANVSDGAEAIWQEQSPRWLARCRELISAAPDYIDAVASKRARLATALPAIIGGKTLALLEAADWNEVATGVKVPRSEVKGILAKAGLVNFRRSGLGKMCREALSRA